MANTLPKEKSLYDRLGGDAVVTRLVNSFYDRILKDPELAPFFEKSSMSNLRHMQMEYFRAALDGPPTYAGLPMVKAHQGRGIKLRHFNLFAQHVLESLKELNIRPDDIEAVISRINLLANEVTGDSITSG